MNTTFTFSVDLIDVGITVLVLFGFSMFLNILKNWPHKGDKK